MEDSEGSYYSNDEEYFLDVCRVGQIDQLKTFVAQLQEGSTFDWGCISYTHDNFLHMLAANNRTDMFQYIFPLVKKKLGGSIGDVLDKQNSTGNTPLHYAVITDSKDMVVKLVQAGVNTNIQNQSNRTPFAEAEQFGKSQIAEILAPITKNNLEELKKEVELLDVCNQDSEDEDEEEEEEKAEKKEEVQSQKKQQ